MANNRYRHILTSFAVAISVLLSVPAQAGGVALGATRVVYPSDQKQVSLAVTNSSSEGAFLVQSWIEDESGKKESRFVITPPLYLMQGKRENTLRIIDATNKSLPQDRESLFWINVKAIPALDKSNKSENTLQLAILSRIKLFYRPLGLSSSVDKAPAELHFSRVGKTLTISNPTPYYLTLTSLNLGTQILENTMVPPKGSATVQIPKDEGGSLSFRTVNDYGALTEVVKAALQ